MSVAEDKAEEERAGIDFRECDPKQRLHASGTLAMRMPS
jgi:hypothetical protein